MAIGVPSMELHRSSPLLSGGRGGNTCLQKKPFFVQAKRLVGMEKASTRPGTQESGQTKKRAPLVRGTVSPPLPVPGNIPRPPYVGTEYVPEIAKEIQMHDKEGIVHMRAACELAARVLDYAGTLVKDGDIINIDVTVYLNGYHGDTSKTFLCGEVDEASKRLVKVSTLFCGADLSTLFCGADANLALAAYYFCPPCFSCVLKARLSAGLPVWGPLKG
ncbi:Methionine aminopeptidase [Zea mays]|uniref:Methionine aminopeptidase n=1 Tax=Zea mays TaxID=4577 RepID=A0A1D6DZY8_MAIZE|nr:Methionine aminopeptidase [Zea mays]